MTRKPKSNRQPRLKGSFASAMTGPVSGGERIDLLLPRNWPAEPGQILWRWQRSGGMVETGAVASLAELRSDARKAKLRVWSPAAESALLHATLPTRSHRQIIQALPYALEDQILGAPQDQHFAYVPDGANLAVAVTSRERLRSWLAALDTAGLRPQSLAPVTFALPLESATWTIAFTQDEIAVRSATHAGFGVPLDNDPPFALRAALAHAAEKQNAPQRFIVLNAPPGFDRARWTSALGAPVEIRAGGILDHAPATSAINLLQGDYATHGEWREIARPYLPAAALLALWLLGSAVSDIVTWGRLWNTHRVTGNEMRALLLKSFPDTTAILDPAKQMQQNVDALLAKSGASLSHDLLPMLARTAPMLISDNRVQVQSLAYADHAITFVASFPDEAALNASTERLRAALVDVLVQSVDRRPGQVKANIRVRPASSAFSGVGS